MSARNPPFISPPPGDAQRIERAERDYLRVGVNETTRLVHDAHVLPRGRETHERVRSIGKIDRAGGPQRTARAGNERIQQQRIAHKTNVRGGAVEAHSGGDHRDRAIAECSAAAVKRSLPASPNVRVGDEHAANVLESA